MEDKTPAQPPIPTPPPPAQHPVIVKKSNNMPLIGAIIFLALVIAGAAVYIGMQKSSTPQVTVVPTPTQAEEKKVVPSPTPVVADDPSVNWEIANIAKMKDLSFPAFSIKHPAAWVAKETKDDISQTVTLTKGADVIKIVQIPTGGSQCIFEGEMPDGPANDYRKEKFTEVKAGTISLRRISAKTTQSFCSNSPQSQDSFGIPTIFGVITYTVAQEDAVTITEMDQILASIRQTP